MQSWLIFVVLALLAVVAVIAHSSSAWRRGAVLLVIAVGAVLGVETLVHVGVLQAADAGGVLAGVAVGVVLFATVLRQISRRARSSPQ